MQCPNCGYELDFDQRFSEQVVCEACQSSIIIDEHAMRLAGKMSALAATPGPLWVGGTGRIGTQSFDVRGRVRYSYEDGYWDEWYLAFDDGSFAWMGEDESDFTLTRLKKAKVKPSTYARARPGSRLNLTGKSFHVDEKGVAVCEGGAGQLPFVVTPGAKTPFLDMSAAGQEFATLEFDLAADTARVFRGKRVPLADIQMDSEKPASELAQAGAALTGSAGGAGHIEVTGQAVKSISCYACGGTLDIQGDLRDTPALECPYCATLNDFSGGSTQCPNCSTAFSVPAGGQARMAVCPECQSQIDLGGGAPRLLEGGGGTNRPFVPFKLGQKFHFDNGDFVLTGHIRFHFYEDGIPYPFDEYLLFNPQHGYIWMIEDEGQYSLAVQLHDPPFVLAGRGDETGGATVLEPHVGASFTYEGSRYRVTEVSLNETRVAWVAGQLPYIAEVGDSVSYLDAKSSGSTISAEWTDREMEYFLSNNVSRGMIAQASGLDPAALGARSLLGRDDEQEWSATRFVFALFLVFNIIGIAIALTGYGATNGCMGHLALAAVCFFGCGAHHHVEWGDFDDDW